MLPKPGESCVAYLKTSYFLFDDQLPTHSMSSKILGSEAEFFSELAVSAVLKVKVEKDNKAKYPIGNIHILKSHGQVCILQS